MKTISIILNKIETKCFFNTPDKVYKDFFPWCIDNIKEKIEATPNFHGWAKIEVNCREDYIALTDYLTKRGAK